MLTIKILGSGCENRSGTDAGGPPAVDLLPATSVTENGAVLHGNMSQTARERSLAQFGSGRVSTLIATDIAARGLDVDDITHVINFDAPADEKAYVHRVGRTARAGRGGEGVTFVTPEQRFEVGRIAKTLHLDAEFVQAGFPAHREPQRSSNGRDRSRGNRRPRPARRG